MSAAGRAAEYILCAVQERGQRTWRQARRTPPLAGGEREPALSVFAERRIRGVSELSVRGLWLLAAGFPAELSSRVPEPEQVLELQAKGGRIVSLLPAATQASEPIDTLAFALHDLCHLAKFAERHYEEQVGFFHSIRDAFEQRAWRDTEARLDAIWLRDRATVSADMNGSSIFLFGVLKMKLKMAARRYLAVQQGSAPPSGGSLSGAEQALFEELLATLLDAMALPAEARDAAFSTSARRDSPDDASRLAGYFQELGAQIVG